MYRLEYKNNTFYDIFTNKNKRFQLENKDNSQKKLFTKNISKLVYKPLCISKYLKIWFKLLEKKIEIIKMNKWNDKWKIINITRYCIHKRLPSFLLKFLYFIEFCNDSYKKKEISEKNHQPCRNCRSLFIFIAKNRMIFAGWQHISY